MAQECYLASMKQKAVDNIYVDELDMRDEVNTRLEPSEELEPIQLDDHPEHLAYIGSKLVEDLRSLLIRFLKQNKDVLAWKQEDMGGIDPTIITHRLSLNPSFKLVKQKEEVSPQKDKKRLMRRSTSSSRQGRSGKWNTLNGWPTWYLLKKRMENGESASISLTSTKHAQKIASLYLGSTS